MEEFATAAAEKAAYADHWIQNAGSFSKQGCYEWMAEQLDNIQPKRIFDIGCGTGQGLLALHRRFDCEIVAIDENLQCLRQAHRLFRNDGIKVGLRFRFKYCQKANGTHSIRIDGAEINIPDRIKLIQADLLLNDTSFETYLRSKAPFDAITIWLIGAYQCRLTCADLFPFQITSPLEYRLHVQNRTYALASKILRPGGVLQVVDRGEALESEELREDELKSHREQAALGDLNVHELRSRPYVERATSKGVGMVMSPGTSGRIPDQIQTTMHSILSVKPS